MKTARLALLICLPVAGSAGQAPSPRPAYEWNMTRLLQNAGRLVPNSGFRGAEAAPALQVLAAAGVALDEDGTPTPRRVVWDPDVADPLGHHEAVTLEFAAASQKQTFLVRADHPGLTDASLILSIRVRRKGDTAGKFVVGAPSKAGGSMTAFNAPAEWTEISVPFQAGASGPNIALCPAADSPLPCGLSIYAPMIREAGAAAIPLAAFRTARHAGHAQAPLALPGAAEADPRGGFLPGGKAGNLQAELVPEIVTNHAMSGWIRVDRLPKARGFFVGFSHTGDSLESSEDGGCIGVFGETNEQDFRGRLHYAPGANLDKQLYSPHLDGSGWLHVHINYGHASPVGPDKVAHELLINGIPFHERATAPMGRLVPRLLSLGGLDGTAKSLQRGEGAWNNPFELVRYEPNTRVSRDAVLARVKHDRETFPNLREPLDALVVVEGDSTSQQRGSPIYMYSRVLRQPGRLFVNHARGGSWYQGGKESNTDYIGTGQRRAMRREAMAKGLDLGYRKVFTLWTPGENDGNGRGLLRAGGDAVAAVRTFTDFILDDLQAVDAGRERTCSIFVSMKMSDFSDGVKVQVRSYWKALESIYTEQIDPVNVPYLYRAPSGTPGRTHDYFIAMHKWAPTNGKHTWKDWEELARDAKADRNGARDIISGDGQHWSQGWNRHVSEAIHIPCLKRIFELEGVNGPAKPVRPNAP